MSKSPDLKAILKVADILRATFEDESQFDGVVTEILELCGSEARTLDDIKPEHAKAVLSALRIAAIGRGGQDSGGMTLKKLGEQWLWVIEAETFVRKRDGRRWPCKQFDSKYNPMLKKSASISAVLFKTNGLIQRYERLAYRPGEGSVCGEDGQAYNLWRPSRIVAAKGDTTLWNAHLEYLFSDEADRNKVLNWLAWVYQNQNLKPHHALLIVGKNTGTGKSFIARVMEQLLGTGNTQRPKNSSLKGDFNGWAANCKLCIIEELMQIGRREVANELRDLITEPFIEVNEKNRPAYLIENHCAMLGISNHDNALPLDGTDRRWIVIGTKVTRREPDYYKRLFEILPPTPPAVSDPLLAAIAYELGKRDLGDYDARSAIVDSEAKREMIGLATPPLLQWLRDEVAAGNAPFCWKLVNVRNDILDHMPDDVAPPRNAGRSAEAMIRDFLRDELNADNFGGLAHRLDKGSAARKGALWGINGAATEYADAGSGDLTRAYLATKQARPMPGPFDDDEDDADEAETMAEAPAVVDDWLGEYPAAPAVD